MASVDVVDVRKSYGAHEVIHGVSIGIGDGEFVILVGPSGYGKSTRAKGWSELDRRKAGCVVSIQRVSPSILIATARKPFTSPDLAPSKSRKGG